MSRMIPFPKKPVVPLEPISILDIVTEIYTVNADGTPIVVDLIMLRKVLEGNISPSALNDDVLRFLLHGSMGSLLKQISEQVEKIF